MNVLPLLTDPNAWAALVTLTVLEIVLGIDNLVFISVLTTRLDPDKARRARQIGLSLAFIFRVIMLAGLTWLMGLTAPIVTLFVMAISWRDIILIGGGLFLIAKATHHARAMPLFPPPRRPSPGLWFNSWRSIWCFRWIRSSPRSEWRRTWR